MLGIRLVSNLVVTVASGLLAQRGFVLRLQRFWCAPLRTPSSDSGYKPFWCSMPTRAINTTHRSWYCSPKTTFVGNSTINDRFPVRQFFRPTIARQPISPTIQTAIYRKCKPFLAGAPVVTHVYHENTTGLIKTIIIITNCTSVCFNVLLFDCANDSYFVLRFLYLHFDCNFARIRLRSVTKLVFWHDLGILSMPRDRQRIHLDLVH
ncbi:hypothetical protein MS3_00001668 [Schistosoma haematobium]|uniref:Secreted protein n=1 Tax=Schistosoma haematobium TaxID=6185 RepID=A0A922LXH0_SCHHA|nr:hypothetical protein MS3_00001667 [Schistosoma haematobium]XP_051074567.1 hypothetical protein MS3_00001668 [Schistosoma haematobium]KAH9595720.1 hypothetical protein MS3_00001667 [Schistosoma haematobium]KAH9595721.1 hypothetical protein MS3_00001668 [Schistosoma haematobium]